MGFRTPVFAVRGRRPRPLDDGGGDKTAYTVALGLDQDEQRPRSILVHRDCGKAGLFQEMIGAKRETAVHGTAGDQPQEIGFKGMGAIDGGRRRHPIGMRMKTSNDPPLRPT